MKVEVGKVIHVTRLVTHWVPVDTDVIVGRYAQGEREGVFAYRFRQAGDRVFAQSDSDRMGSEGAVDFDPSERVASIDCAARPANHSCAIIITASSRLAW